MLVRELNLGVADQSATMGAQAARGALVTSAVQGLKMGIQILSVILLSRLLSPEDFGVFGMVMPIVGFMLMMQDLGLTQAIIAVPGITTRQVSGLFWINFILASILAIGLVAVSPFIAAFYGEPEVEYLAYGLAASVVFAGIISTPIAVLTRLLRFNELAFIDISSALFGFLVALVVAIYYPGPWALALSVLANMGLAVGTVWFLLRWRPGGPTTVKTAGQLLSFGAGISVFNFAQYFSRNLDQILIGRQWGADQLGYYDRAYKLLAFPMQQINAPLGRIVLPMLSRLSGDSNRYRAAFTKVLQQITLIFLPGMLCLIFTASEVLTLLLGEKWLPATPIFLWLAISGLHAPVGYALGWLFVTQQRSNEYAIFGVFNALACIASFVIGLPWGAVGVAAAYATVDILVRAPVLWWYVGRKGAVSTADIARAMLPMVIGGVAVAATLAFITAMPLNSIPKIALSLATAYSVMGMMLIALPQGRSVVLETLGIGRTLLQRA